MVEGTIGSPVEERLVALWQQLARDDAGSVADYIPELGKADPEWFGICVATADGHVYEVGDASLPFTIQSISKPFAYGLALEDHGIDGVLSHVGVEPTGDAFNSIVVDQRSNRPFNPMVNAGAIVTAGLVRGRDLDEKQARMMDMFARWVGHEVAVDEAVFESERDTGDRNRAIAYMMRGFGMLEGAVEETLELYFRQCSILVSCRDLAVMAATLANGGVNPVTGERALSHRHVERVLSVMASCGMYDYAGEWGYTVGLPAKSGVSGGILAVLPGQLGIGTFSPPLDERGNSVRGVGVCRSLARDYALHPLRPHLPTMGIVRRTYRGDQVRSSIVRTPDELALLERDGGTIAVVELQGELFFGSAEVLARALTRDLDGVSMLVLDCRRLGATDDAGATLTAATVAAVEGAGCTVVLAHLAADHPLAVALGPNAWIVPDADSALERCEQRVLAGAADGHAQEARLPLSAQELLQGLSSAQLAALERVVRLDHVEPGHLLLRMGDPADEVVFLLEGAVSVRLPVGADGRAPRLAGFGPGVAVGELALLDDATRSADVVVDEPSVVAVLALADLDGLAAEDPALRATIMRNLAANLAGRLRRANTQVRALEG